MQHPLPLLPSHNLLLRLTLLLPTPQSSQIAPRTLPRICNTLASVAHATSHCPSTALHAIDSALAIASERSLRLDGVSVLVLAAALSAVDALLGQRVADGLREAALADLPGDEAVDAVLEIVDLRYAC